MKLVFVLFLSMTLLTGCGALKSATGDFVKEAVEDKIREDIDKTLAAKGLSLEQIKASIDTNRDKTVSKEELLSAAKDYSKDFLVLELHKYMSERQAKKSNSGDNETLWQEFIGIISAAISAFLLREIQAAKSNGQTKSRLEVMEKILGYDPDEANHKITPPIPGEVFLEALARKAKSKKEKV